MTDESAVHWFKVLTVSGLDGGLGFTCDRCHLSVPHSATRDSQVAHCGGVSQFKPGWFEKIPTVRLKNPSREGLEIGGSRIVPVDF